MSKVDLFYRYVCICPFLLLSYTYQPCDTPIIRHVELEWIDREHTHKERNQNPAGWRGSGVILSVAVV